MTIVFWLVPLFILPMIAILVLHRPRDEFTEVVRRSRAITALEGIYQASEHDRIHHHGDRPVGGLEHQDEGSWPGRFRVVGGGADRRTGTETPEEAIADEHGVA